MLGKRLIAGFHHCTNSPCWSKSATPKHILGVSLSQLLRQWRSWRTGSAAYANNHNFKYEIIEILTLTKGILLYKLYSM